MSITNLRPKHDLIYNADFTLSKVEQNLDGIFENQVLKLHHIKKDQADKEEKAIEITFHNFTNGKSEIQDLDEREGLLFETAYRPIVQINMTIQMIDINTNLSAFFPVHIYECETDVSLYSIQL